ncbi:heptaprenylglyceryl phosphate synthase [Paenibacillus senegalensis]|uniref:heptaprenylglyceryl phosphate synthase n=1 Tax=Paenibacillus senegalensis TaxID=1465766 RepID=UPI0002884F88|nr:heptaprenylglyceryl phosphate synthase [Paenibacillus senegalensis]
MLLDEIKQWKHVFKLDPDRSLSDDALERICLSGTDAIIVGGSSGVTFDNTVELLGRIRRYALPCVQEISAIDSVVPGFDGYLIPIVLNTRNGDWICGHQQRALKEYGAVIDWSAVLAEGYVILNEESTAARVTEAEASLDEQDLIAYARMADKLFRFPVFYVEYSGIYGDLELVSRAARVLEESRLFYGGGITNAAKARKAAAVADTIVVGNAVYDNLAEALDTVKAAKEDDNKQEGLTL